MSRPYKNKETDKNPVNSDHDWNDCEGSVIEEMVKAEQRAHRREAIKRIGVTSLSAFSVLAGYTLWNASRQPTMEERRKGLIIPIRCQTAMDQLAYYHHNELDDGMARRVTFHLKRCPGCRGRYEKTYGVKFA